MTEVTLDEIKSTQTKLAEMIEQYERSQNAVTYLFQAIEIKLRPGEHYAGLIVGKDGEPSHHIILLPSEAENVTFEEAEVWAIEIGGDLPTRREQSLLDANLKGQLKPAWHWSGEVHSDPRYALSHNFNDGSQSYHYRDSIAPIARAVRRLKI